MHRISISAEDLEASVAFYAEVLGMEQIPGANWPEPVAYLLLGDQQLEIVVRTALAPQIHEFALGVDDLDSVRRKLGRLAGDVWFSDPRELPDGSASLYVRDPAGHVVELRQSTTVRVP